MSKVRYLNYPLQVQLLITEIRILDRSPDLSTLRCIHAALVTSSTPGWKPHLRTFIRWNAMGHKFAQLASGGSVYVLLMVAGLDLCVDVSRALGRLPFEVGKMLRRPDDSPAGRLVRNRIVPTIAYMRKKLPLRLDTSSWYDLKHSHMDCTSLKDSDRFFDSLERW